MQSDYRHRKFKDGESIFSQDDRAGEAYLIKSGQVRIHNTENGRIREIDVIGQGKIFGEMGVISDMNRMASADAVGETHVISCERRELLRRVDELDEDRRDALRFLIVYCQEFLPFELMDERPENDETLHRDEIAFNLVRESNKPGALDGLDSFMTQQRLAERNRREVVFHSADPFRPPNNQANKDQHDSDQ